MIRLLCLLLCFLAAITTAEGPIDVLVIGDKSPSVRTPWWAKLQDTCARQGVRLHILGEGIQKDSLALHDFTDDFLRQFEVVIFNGTPSGEAYGQFNPDVADPDAVAAAFRDRLDAYYRAGGGVLWCPLAFGHGGTYWAEVVGKRYDARSLEEDIYDPGKRVLAVPMFDRKPRSYYIWTTAIARHPVTAGVRGLVLPMEGEWSWPGTIPYRYGPSWTVLVRGMETTSTIRNAQPVGSGLHDFKPELQGTYDSAPEIIGARDGVDGSGRMLVVPFHTAYTWLNYGNWAMGDAFLANGAPGHPSDGLKLILNGCKWLAEPARAAGLGGYRPPPRKTVAEVPPVDWSKAAFTENSWSGMGTWWNARLQEDNQMAELETPAARDFRGVIGVRTAASGGTGTVAEYVAAARELGLSFIVFAEDLTQLDDDKYAKLIADCKAASDDTFRAVPGYRFRDLVDVPYFLFDIAALPAPENLTPERRVKVPDDLVHVANGYRGCGIAELTTLKTDPWYLLGFSCIAVRTYDGDKLVDDGLDVYRSLQGRMHSQPPVAFTRVDTPAQLRAVVDHAAVTVIHDENLNAALGRIAWKRHWNPNPVYVTDGPTIGRWGVLNPIGNPYAAGKQRTRFALEVSSDRDLADVRIIEARSGRLFRHFRPTGKTFACTVDETHKDQWYLVPVITDSAGRQAVGPTLKTFQDGHRLSPYMDNIDAGSLCIGYDEKRRTLPQYGSWLGHIWSKGVLTGGSLMGSTRPEGLRFWGFDGGPIAGSHCWVSPQLVTATLTEPPYPAYRFENWLASFDYAVGHAVGDRKYIDNQRRKRDDFPTHWWAITEPTVPMEFADIDVRNSAVHARYHAPVAARVVQVTVTFKKPCTVRAIELCRTWRSFDWGPMFAAVKDREGRFSWLDDKKENRHSRRGILDPGGYLFAGTDCGGAPAVVNMGPTPLAYTYRDQRFAVRIDGEDRQVAAGDRWTARFLMLGRPWEDQNNTAWLERFIADYAVGGGTPGYACDVTRGTVTDLNYLMRLAPDDGGATVRIGKYDLPHNLLVQVGALPANAIAGRYDLDRRQLLILPVYEGAATTSVNTTLGDTRLYAGELFHCSDPEVLLSAVQDGTDALLVEVHNPTAAARPVVLTAVPGFAPLAGLARTVQVPPYASVKLTLPTPAGTLVAAPYAGE